MKKRNIKNLTIGLLTVTLLGTVLTGCSNTDNKKVDGTTEDIKQEEVDIPEDVIGIPKEDIGHRPLLINELIDFKDFTVKVTGYSLTKDDEGKDTLVITYDWENTSKGLLSPINSFDIRGFQESGETGNSSIVKGIDFATQEKEYKKGEKLEGAKATLRIHDLDKDLLVELDELSPDSNVKHSSTVKPNELK